MEELDVVELFIDEDNVLNGIEAISIVEHPAIEEDFVALKEQGRLELAKVDEDKRILMGAALIPDKKIYRRNKEGEEYEVWFSKDTVRQASEIFFQKGLQSETTLEHEIDLKGNTVVESWIKESEVDKSVANGIDVPIGTWLISMKVEDDAVWELAKQGKIKAFSIEGKFADIITMTSEKSAKDIHKEIVDMIENVTKQ